MTAPSLREVIDVLDTAYPPSLAEGWDSVGLVAGDPADPVHKVLLAVDATADVVDEALEWGAQLLFVHHPLLLRGVDTVIIDEIHALVAGKRGARVIDADGQVLAVLPHPARVHRAAFSPNGFLIATAGADGDAIVWRSSGARLRVLPGPADSESNAFDVSFSPLSRLLVVASSDGAARVWNVRNGHRESVMPLHRTGVRRARFGGARLHGHGGLDRPRHRRVDDDRAHGGVFPDVERRHHGQLLEPGLELVGRDDLGRGMTRVGGGRCGCGCWSSRSRWFERGLGVAAYALLYWVPASPLPESPEWEWS